MGDEDKPHWVSFEEHVFDQVVDQLRRERTRQIDMGWTPAHDQQHGTTEWVWLFTHQIGNMLDPAADADQVHEALVQLGAEVIAALEARQRDDHALLERLDGGTLA